MTPIPLMLLLLALGVALLVGELLLPTHGVLGIAGLAALFGAIAVCFYINRWLGLGVFLGAIVVSPFVWTLAVSVWMKSPVGKRLTLPPVTTERGVITLRAGDAGRAVTELRPIGECEFNDERLEAISEHGIIPAGSQVTIVAMGDGRPIVRRRRA